ncbi:hypothetical protein ACKA0G_10155 [Priestia megaterium]|uniref:hypothetical protein n=1 Tax=Priestia megaterium TaxID=1404 RepID=UPI0038A6FCCC
MILRNIFTDYECTQCGKGQGRDVEYIEWEISKHGEKHFLSEMIECKCGNKFNRYEGIIESFVSDNIYSKWRAFCDITLAGEANITIGKQCKIVIPKQLLISKIFLTNIEGFASLAPEFYSHIETDSFNIVSSEVNSEGSSDPSNYKKIGENHKVDWFLFGKSGDKPVETWLLLLTQASEQILHGQYNIAILTSEMMFESFLDDSLNKQLISKGLSKEASYTILESMRSIYDKAHKLLKDLTGQGLQSAGKGKNSINAEWQELVRVRNKIAHGEQVEELNKEKAEWALRTALKAIFFIYINSLTD